MKSPASISELSQGNGPVASIDAEDRIPLPPPYDTPESEPESRSLSEQARERFACLDDTVAVNIVKPQSSESCLTRPKTGPFCSRLCSP